MERILLRAALGLVVINTGVLLWLHQQPLPPDRIPEVEAVPDPHEGSLEAEQAEPEDQSMAALDAILAQRLTAEAAAQGLTPALPDDTLRQAAARAPADSDEALLLLAAYEREFATLGLSLDGLGQ
jgi:hypothetical protein